VELTVDDIWQIADVGDQELRRLAHSTRRGTLELGAEDNDGLSQQASTALDIIRSKILSSLHSARNLQYKSGHASH